MIHEAVEEGSGAIDRHSTSDWWYIRLYPGGFGRGASGTPDTTNAQAFGDGGN